MDYFNYKNGELFAENISIKEITTEIETPFYCYSANTLRHHFKIFKNTVPIDSKICFAIKSNNNLKILKILSDIGAGADVVSKGEISLALKAGISANKIIFSGVGKQKYEIEFALRNDIFQFNVESLPELELISKTANEMGKIANIAFRVNPDVDAKTHSKISTGKAENKFGIPYSEAEEYYAIAANLPNINIQGISIHIGSQLLDLSPFREAFLKIPPLLKRLTKNGYNITTIDLGGGLGIPYNMADKTPPPSAYGELVKEIFNNISQKLIFEPGRLIAGNAGILVSQIIYVKRPLHKGKNFLIIDAAMNDLMRPSLYEAHHEIIPIDENIKGKITVDVVGPICETGDIFARNITLPNLQSGDILAFRSSGAYGATMSSTYNSRPLTPEIIVDDDKYIITRK